MNANQLAQLLWRIDPMGTCCNVNDGMEEEYQREAHDLAERLQAGEAPRSAVLAVFDHWFWEGCLLGESKLEPLEQIVAALKV